MTYSICKQSDQPFSFFYIADQVKHLHNNFSYGWVKLIKSLANVANPSKPSSSVKNAKDKAVKSANPSASTTNVEAFVESILDKTSQLLLKEVSRILFSFFTLNFGSTRLGSMI